MSVNFSQNPEYMQQQGNFGANNMPMPEAPPQVGMLQTMGLPTNRDEFVKWSPHFAVSLGIAKLITYLTDKATILNPFKSGNGAATVAESYTKSKIATMSKKIDDFLLPHISKHSAAINATKGFFKKFTPDWVKNLYEKFTIGVTPKATLALGTYKGCTVLAGEHFIDLLKGLPESEQVRLGVKNILETVIKDDRKSLVNAIKNISAAWAGKNAKDLQALTKDRRFFFNLIPMGKKKLNLVGELNKAKTFIGTEAKTPLTKGLQKALMYSSESVSGGVIGGGLFGLVMNSIFLASTIKRTWEAPKGEKLSTFMEGALVEFLGGYLLMILGSRLTYKLLGLKNADKTAAQLKNIKNVTTGINANRKLFDKTVIKALKNGTATENVVRLAKAYNASIDELAKLRGFQKSGHFFRDLFNRPLRWIGNFFSAGLENLPAKIATKDMSTLAKMGIGWRKFANGFKFLAGYPLRFFLVLMVVTPPLTKLMGKISHTLFGKPTKSIVDEREGKTSGQEQSNNPSKTTTQNQQMPTDKMEAYAQIMKEVGKIREAQQPSNLPQNYNPQISQTLVNDAISSQRSRIEAQKNAPQNLSPATYIPSIVPTPQTDIGLMAQYQKNMEMCDKIEQFADKELDLLRSKGDIYQI